MKLPRPSQRRLRLPYDSNALTGKRCGTKAVLWPGGAGAVFLCSQLCVQCHVQITGQRVHEGCNRLYLTLRMSRQTLECYL